MHRVLFAIFYYIQQMHNYLIKLYITIISLCNLYFYKFRQFCVNIGEFITNALLAVDNTIYN